MTLGRFDINFAVMIMSRFMIDPNVGHLERLKRIYGYLRKNPDAKIKFCLKILPKEKYFEVKKYDWMHSVYGKKSEEFVKGLPVPKGKAVRTTAFHDSGLCACRVTGKSSTGVITLINHTPVDWLAVMQKLVETATYGSKF